MEFTINVGKFLSSLVPVVDVATKNAVKDFEGALNILLNATDKELIVTSHGGSACLVSHMSSNVIDGLKYSCAEGGEVVVESKKLLESLNSIRPSTDINIKVDDQGSGGVKITFVDGNEPQLQTLPFSQCTIVVPKLASKFIAEIEVNREIFIDGMDKVKFAVGIEQHRPQYLCQIFDADKDVVKFISGSGGRFAVSEVTGKNIVGCSRKQRVVFPKNNLSNIINVLKTSTSEKISIKEAESTADTIDQIIIQCDNITLIICGIDANIKAKYADIHAILNQDHDYQCKIDIDDLLYPIKGARATYSEEIKKDSDVHNAEITTNFKKNIFTIKAATNMKSKRTIQVDKIKSTGKDISFFCNSGYFAEMLTQGYSSGDVVMRFFGQGQPIVVDFPDIENGVQETVEKYSVFFTTAAE